ncbi:homocysteine S-methyltransferase [Nannocystaceae bacterium ST9]
MVPFAVLDGGLATELERHGCSLDDPLWSAKALIEQPERVLAVHRSWLAAGADVITTASYQASFAGLAARGIGREDAEALLRRSVALARAAVDERGRGSVAASIGSHGAYLADGSEYRGDYGLDRTALIEFHRDRLVVLSEGADLLAFETMPDAGELAAIAELLAAVPGPPAWVSLSLAPDQLRLADGTALADALAPLRGHPRVLAIGVNCLAPRRVHAALLALRELVEVPLIAYPNSGERWCDRAWAGDELEVEAFAALAIGWFEAGARWIGGCCRTRPEHVRALVEARARLAGELGARAAP